MTIESVMGDQTPIPFSDLVRANDVGSSDDRGRDTVMVTHTQDFFVAIGNTKYLRQRNDIKAYIAQCFGEAKICKFCVVVKYDGPYDNMFHHRSVHTHLYDIEENQNRLHDSLQQEIHSVHGEESTLRCQSLAVPPNSLEYDISKAAGEISERARNSTIHPKSRRIHSKGAG